MNEELGTFQKSDWFHMYNETSENLGMRSATVLLLTFIISTPILSFSQTADKKKTAVNTVAYSYEKWDRVEPKQYVMVPRAVKIPAGTLAERSRALLTKLKRAKGNTYGNVRPAFKPDVEKTGEVYIYLDETPRFKKYHAIVIAETVYTFTENGATKVIFPKVRPQGVTRARHSQLSLCAYGTILAGFATGKNG